MGTVVNNRKQNGDTETCIGEYVQGISQLIDEEVSKAKGLADQEASRILAEAHHQAQQITKEAAMKAEEESVRYVSELNQKAEKKAAQLEEEAQSRAEEQASTIIARSFEEGFQILARARQAAELEVTEILASSRKDTEQIIGAIDQMERATTEVRSRVLNEFEEYARVIQEVKVKLEQAVQVAEKVTKKELEELNEAVAQIHFSDETMEMKQPMAQVEASLAVAETSSSKLYKGQVELEVKSPGGYGQTGMFMEHLRKVPDIQLKSLGSFVQGKIAATVSIANPLPLVSIITEIPLVKRVVEQGNRIEVELRAT